MMGSDPLPTSAPSGSREPHGSRLAGNGSEAGDATVSYGDRGIELRSLPGSGPDGAAREARPLVLMLSSAASTLATAAAVTAAPSRHRPAHLLSGGGATAQPSGERDQR